MSMIGNFLSVDESSLQALISGETDVFELERAALSGESEHQFIDVDKCWQAIHFLLCQKAYEGETPMGYVVPLRDINACAIETNYGAFFLHPEQVREASGYLQTLTEEKIKAMYDYQAMLDAAIYPLLPGEEDDDFFDYVYGYFSPLKDFYLNAAQKGYSVLFYIM
ncbi:MAG: YfbM family protein [Christensenellales bacterium]|jgi:hypothetical protein